MPDSVLGKIALEIGGGVTGGGSPSSLSSGMGGGGNGADKAVKEQTGILGKMRESSSKVAQVMGGQTRWWGKALKTMGIQVGVAGILKQSQIFTSTLGAMFQIFGAMVDVLLAPWLPVIIPMIRWMARGIPKFARASERAFEVAQNKIWPTIQRWFNNIKSGSWWTGIMVDAIKGILPTWLGGTGNEKDPGEKAITGIKGFLPGWMGGEGTGSSFPEIPFLSAIAEKLGALGPIVASIATLTGIFVGAKAVRYFTAFAKHIPVLGGLFKPFHILTRFMDEIAHLSIRLVMPGRLLSVWDEIVNTLYAIVGKAKPRVPAVPDPAKSRIWDRDEARDRGRLRQQRASDAARKARLANKGITRPTPGDKLFRNFDDMGDVGKQVTGGADEVVKTTTQTTAGGADDAARIKKITDNPFMKKALALKNFLGQIMSRKITNINQLKALGAQVLTRLQELRGMVGASGLGRGASRMMMILGGFAKYVIPPLATAYMIAETSYDLKQMWDSPKPWMKDVQDPDAWVKDFARVGGGKMIEASVGAGFGESMARKFLPDRWIRDDMKNVDNAKRMREMGMEHFQADPGVFSGGKGLPLFMRAITGGAGIAGAAVPGPWTIPTTLAYEGGRMVSQEMAGTEGFMDMIFREWKEQSDPTAQYYRGIERNNTMPMSMGYNSTVKFEIVGLGNANMYYNGEND